MSFEGVFENPFAESYMRNHKAVTVKNLRCFPKCSDSEHKDNGFCGNEVIVKWTTTKVLSQGTIFQTFSEFQEASTPPSFVVGQIIPEKDLATKTTLMKGEVSVNENLSAGSLSFSRESKGWHYGWMAGRGNGAPAYHEMRVYLFEKVADGTCVCDLVIASPKFQVTSRKRVRTKKVGGGDSPLSQDRPLPALPSGAKKRKGDEPLVAEAPKIGKRSSPEFTSTTLNSDDQLPTSATTRKSPEMPNLATLPQSSVPPATTGAPPRGIFSLQSLFGPGGYSISSTPPIYHPPSATPPTYQFLFPGASQHNLLSGLPSITTHQSDLDNSVLEVLWQPTPPNSFAQILNARQQLIQKQLDEEKEKQAKSVA